MEAELNIMLFLERVANRVLVNLGSRWPKSVSTDIYTVNVPFEHSDDMYQWAAKELTNVLVNYGFSNKSLLDYQITQIPSSLVNLRYYKNEAFTIQACVYFDPRESFNRVALWIFKNQ